MTPQTGPQGVNRLLQHLPPQELSLLTPHMKRVALNHQDVLHPSGETIEHLYFPLSGMISLVTIMKSGAAIESGIVAREGLAGGSIILDGWRSFTQAIVQMPGEAMRIDAAHFMRAYNAGETLRTLTNKFQSVLHLQAQQTAACHALHPLDVRLCRWLLHAHDASGGDKVDLTQESLSHMLGVRRTTVSVSASDLQKSGMIQYSRGRIGIVDRAGLEECACECYGVVRNAIDTAIPPLSDELPALPKAS